MGFKLIEARTFNFGDTFLDRTISTRIYVCIVILLAADPLLILWVWLGVRPWLLLAVAGSIRS